jgi:hypothetical protein
MKKKLKGFEKNSEKYKINKQVTYESKMMSMQKVNSEIMKMMKSVVEVCASKYNFDAEEGYRMICSCEGLEVKSSSKRSKKISQKPVKSAFPLPYNGEMNGECCMGIRLNSGLYTQCPSIRPESAAYCGSCDKQAASNEHGLPDYGNIQTRLSKYTKDEEFVDPSGKKPVAYTKVMKKFKVTEEQVREEASKHNMVLDPRHFVEVEKKSGRPASKVEKEPKELKAKGRPKKSKKVLELAGEEEDLFASLVMSSLVPSAANKVDDVIEETVTSEAESEVDSDLNEVINSSLGDVDVISVAAKPSKASKPKVSAEEKKLEAEQKKLALAEQKAAEKLALAEQKKAEALAQQNQKLALAEQKAAEKLALAEQKKAEALAQQNQKLALAEQKKAEKQALAEQKKKPLSEAKKEKKVKNDNDDDRPTPTFVAPPDDADVVKKIMFEGKKYLKSKNTGIIYNMEQDVIGKWNEEKNRIDFDETGEESEEEYDEDN